MWSLDDERDFEISQKYATIVVKRKSNLKVEVIGGLK